MINLDNMPKNGTAVTFKHRGASFQMIIESARIRYGQVDVKLSPIAGEGAFWVKYDTLNTTTEETVTPVEQALNS